MNEREIAKKVITEELEKDGYKVLKIILFGSRARGDFKRDSDWDFYVIVNKEIDFHTKKKISARIRIKMAEFKIPNDIIIQSNSIVNINMRKDNVGYLTYYVLKEGVEV